MKKQLLLLLLIIMSLGTKAQMTARVVRDSLFIPWELVYGPDNHIWFAQKNGFICRMEPVSGIIDTLYQETNTYVAAEGGMLGLALHPSFPAQPYVYVAYVYNTGTPKERIVRYTYGANTLSAPQVLLDNINAANFHNGCRMIAVGDKLFLSTGDATTASIAQNVNAVNGKILRINLDGTIPADNPIPGNPVWSWGHRNPQGLVYANGRIYSSEHGPNNDDEINIIQKGRNFGWPNVEGFCNTGAEITFCNDSNVVQPLRAWTPTLAVSGIDYYNHNMFPTLQQSILMTTLKDEHLYQLKLNNTFDTILSATIIPQADYGRLRDICIAPDGRIFLSTSNSSASGGGPFVDKIIELYDPTVTSVNFLENSSELFLYPNPAGEYTKIELPATISDVATMKYLLISEDGRIAEEGKFFGHSTTLYLSDLANGLYFIHITAPDGKVFRSRLLKQL